MATIRRVTFHRLRNVQPGCTIELHPGLNVLLGQNGTGKTTLLQWLADFLSGNLGEWAQEPYRVEAELEVATAHLQVKLENEVSETPAEQELAPELSALRALTHSPARSGMLSEALVIQDGELRYEILARPSHVSVRCGDQPIRESDRRLGSPANATPIVGAGLDAFISLSTSTERATKDSAGESLVTSIANSLARVLRQLPTGIPLLQLDDPGKLVRFDESLDFFRSLVEGSETRVRVMTAKGRSQPFLSSFIAPRIQSLIAQAVQTSKSAPQTLTFSSEEVQGFLSTFVRLLQYRSAKVSLDFLEKEKHEGFSVSTYGNLRFTFERHDGSIIGHEKLSYGQKRMLSFLYYLALNPRIIIVDELVNGLHHAWIEACIEEIGDRQAILTSQNPLLLDYLTFESPDDVRRRFVLCRSERDADTGREQLIWRNPTQDEAESFHRAYQAGIQHVGEILVDEGFW